VQSYHLAIIYALGLAGALWLFLGSKSLAIRPRAYGLCQVRSVISPKAGRGKVAIGCLEARMLGAWLLTFPLFTLADYWVDQR
jgi:hypothetical protein